MIVFKFPNVQSSDKPQMQMWKANAVLALGNGWVHCACKKAPLLFRDGCKLPFWYNPWVSGLGTQKLAWHTYCSPIIPSHQSSTFCQHWATLIPRAGSHKQACTSMSPAAHGLSYCSLLSSGSIRPCASTANGAAALRESEVQCCHGESWAGGCPVVSEHGHCPSMGRGGVFPSGGEGCPPQGSSQRQQTKCAQPSPLGTSLGCLHIHLSITPPSPLFGLPSCPARGWGTCSSPPLSLLACQSPGFFGESGSCKWCSW